MAAGPFCILQVFFGSFFDLLFVNIIFNTVKKINLLLGKVEFFLHSGDALGFGDPPLPGCKATIGVTCPIRDSAVAARAWVSVATAREAEGH